MLGKSLLRCKLRRQGHEYTNTKGKIIFQIGSFGPPIPLELGLGATFENS